MRSPTDVTVEDFHLEKYDPIHVKQEAESEMARIKQEAESEMPRIKQEAESEMPRIKQEAEPETPYIKEEELEDEISKFPMCVSVKIEEDEGPSEESGSAKHWGDSSFQHLTTKGEGQSQTDGLLAPLSDSDDVTSHSSDFNTDEEEDDFDQKASKSLNMSSRKRNTQKRAVRKAAPCTLCVSHRHHCRRSSP
ncbi:uncharacterized protein LOC130918803 isoform X6 [Corythoichthys intestinalis]|uniref:uncharacterized protein LOC130918803 isoform X6 n=1 Tax=Corythoichthys intestinalis TaxID=161448 RepID=UPI0025A62589|nr:uncharacterized protein LOC130918803 isoform X6 [Corythoichthys intestinalis]